MKKKLLNNRCKQCITSIEKKVNTKIKLTSNDVEGIGTMLYVIGDGVENLCLRRVQLHRLHERIIKVGILKTPWLVVFKNQSGRCTVV